MKEQIGKLIDMFSFKKRQESKKYINNKIIEQILQLSEYKREQYHWTSIFNIKIYKYDDLLFCEPQNEAILINKFGTSDWRKCITDLINNKYVPNNVYLDYVLGYSQQKTHIMARILKQSKQLNRTKSEVQKEGNMKTLKKLSKLNEVIDKTMAEDIWTKNKTWMKVVKYYENKYNFTAKEPEAILMSKNVPENTSGKSIYKLTLTNLIKDKK